MKNENVFPLRVFRDELHEANTKRDLQAAQTTLQAVLEIWNGLELIPCTDIFQLILNPQTAYANAVNTLAEPPETKGRFQVSKKAYIDTLEIPIPDSLYMAAKEARKFQYTNMPELWSIENDNTIVLEETGATALIDSQSIYVTTEEQKILAINILTYVELTNIFAEKFPGDFVLQSPSANMFLGNGKFAITQKSYPGPYSIEIIPYKLREWLSL